MSTQKPLIPFVSGLDKQQINDWLQHLHGAIQHFEIALLETDNLHHFKDTEVAIVANPDVTLLGSLPRLKWVQSLWAGIEGLVSQLPNDVLICRMTDVELQHSMAEAALAWSLYLHRHMHLYREQQINKTWQQHQVVSAGQRTVSVLGAGLLGQACCQRLQGNGFKVKAWSRTQKHIPNLDTFFGISGLPEVLANADIVILLLPLTSETYRLFDNDTFKLLKPGACLINFARGGIVDYHALLSALDSGTLSHAVLDVFETEPLPKDDPLWEMPNVTVLPHISAPTNMQSASVIAAGNIQQWLETGQFPEVVDRNVGY